MTMTLKKMTMPDNISNPGSMGNQGSIFCEYGI